MQTRLIVNFEEAVALEKAIDDAEFKAGPLQHHPPFDYGRGPFWWSVRDQEPFLTYSPNNEEEPFEECATPAYHLGELLAFLIEQGADVSFKCFHTQDGVVAGWLQARTEDRGAFVVERGEEPIATVVESVLRFLKASKEFDTASPQ